MATLVIRKVDEGVKDRIRRRALSHGRSMEEEVRTILRQAVGDTPPRTGRDFVASIRSKFAPLGGVELDLPLRDPVRDPPSFEE